MSATSASLLRAIIASTTSPSGVDGCTGHGAERRPLVAEDPRVAVLVGADRADDPEVGQDAGEDRHRVLVSRVLGVRLDARKGRFRVRALDLELRHEHGRLAAGALRIHDGPLVREEPETREVLDVVGAEEDVARQALIPDVLEQSLPPLAELGRRRCRTQRRRVVPAMSREPTVGLEGWEVA